MSTRPRPTILLASAGLVLAVALVGACSDDEPVAADADDTTTTTEVSTTHGEHDADDATVTIAGVDYGFDDVPESVPAGTKLSFTNRSDVELHEMVVFRIPDDVDAPLDELVQLPPEELEAMLGAPVTVMLQPPGAPEPVVAVGDGTLAEPGRYALMCFIPVGADPDEYMAAVQAAGGGKPSGVAGGPPHFVSGMYAELAVD